MLFSIAPKNSILQKGFISVDSDKWHKNRSNPELPILLLHFAHCSNHLAFAIFQHLQNLSIRTVLHDHSMKPTSYLQHVVILGFDRKLQDELPKARPQAHEMWIFWTTAMNCHPEFTLLICSDIIGESRQHNEKLGGSGLLTLDPKSSQPTNTYIRKVSTFFFYNYIRCEPAS